MTPDHACDGFTDVPAHFRRDAPMDRHQRRRHDAVLALLRDLPPGRVLDYGFGWGDIACQASKTHPDIHAVDVEPRRVDFARREYAPIPFDLCRADGLDFPEARFDIVLSIVVLPFVPDDDAYMAEIRRVLRPGGKLIVATKTTPYLSRAWRRLGGRRAPVVRRRADVVQRRRSHRSRLIVTSAAESDIWHGRLVPASQPTGRGGSVRHGKTRRTLCREFLTHRKTGAGPGALALRATS